MHIYYLFSICLQVSPRLEYSSRFTSDSSGDQVDVPAFRITGTFNVISDILNISPLLCLSTFTIDRDSLTMKAFQVTKHAHPSQIDT